MSQKITCPHCKKEFPMEDGLSSHLKDIETKAREKLGWTPSTTLEELVSEMIGKDLQTATNEKKLLE